MYVGPKSAAYLHNCTFQANQAVSGKLLSLVVSTAAHLPQAAKQQASGRLMCCPPTAGLHGGAKQALCCNPAMYGPKLQLLHFWCMSSAPGLFMALCPP